MSHSRKPSVSQRTGLWRELLHSLRLAWRLLWDPRIATLTKAVIPGIAFLYVFSPIDFSPDFLPLLGQVDDLAILMVASRLFISFCPPEIVRYHESAINAERQDSRRQEEVDDSIVDTTYRVIEDEDS